MANKLFKLLYYQDSFTFMYTFLSELIENAAGEKKPNIPINKTLGITIIFIPLSFIGNQNLFPILIMFMSPLTSKFVLKKQHNKTNRAIPYINIIIKIHVFE